jgi:DNA-binding GntR family transcriptional regulator
VQFRRFYAATEREGFEEYRAIGKAVLAGNAKRAEVAGRAHVRRIADNLEHLPDNAFDLPTERA